MKRRGHRDPVTPELRQAVFDRDGYCAAPVIDADCGPCSGRSQIEHVLEQSRMAKRAPSDLAHCVALCENHTEPGMKAGRVWNLSHKADLRRYLAQVNPEEGRAA